MAITGIEMAAWDALARAAGLPLARLLGGTMAPIPAYARMRSMRPDDLRREAEGLMPLGFEAFKFKIGWPDLAQDIAAIKAMRDAVGPQARLMVDFNQSLSVAEAKRRLAAFESLDLDWVEEPLPMSDLDGQVELQRFSRIALQAGENWWGPQDAQRSLAAGATLSSHIVPEVSAHLLAVTPTAHRLEYLDLASPVLAEPLRIENGRAVASTEPGSGISWRENAVARLAV
jgi:mandelate racemase